MLSRACSSPFLFFWKNQNGKGARVHCRHRHGQLMQRSSSAVFLFVLCVAGASSAIAPQGCEPGVLMYMGVG